MTDTIKAIQKQIVTKLEAGEDITGLTRQLTRERAKIAAQAEVEQLKKIADERQTLRDKAEAIKVKVQKQGEAIDSFLKARDTITETLAPIVDKAKELPELQKNCYAEFNDIQQFAWTVRNIPLDYLGKGFGCPLLESQDGLTDPRDRAAQAIWYINAGLGLLQSLKRGLSQLPLSKAEGLLEVEPETEAGSCIVCSHAEVEAINNLLRQGRPLRDIESEFGVSRSSLSRHKNNCLNLGAVRMRD